jgi:chemotaxis protein methyltransferase WspC
MCRTYLAAHPAEAEAHFLMGLIEAAAGRPEAAERAMEHALYLDPTHYEAAVHLGLIYDRAGDGTRADAMRRRAARTFDAGRTGHEVSRAAGGNRR